MNHDEPQHSPAPDEIPDEQTYLPITEQPPGGRRTDREVVGHIDPTGAGVFALTESISELDPELAARMLDIVERQQEHKENVESKQLDLAARQMAIQERQMTLEETTVPELVQQTGTTRWHITIIMLAVLGVIVVALVTGNATAAFAGILLAGGSFAMVFWGSRSLMKQIKGDGDDSDGDEDVPDGDDSDAIS